MEERLLAMLTKIRVEAMKQTLKKFTFSEIEKKTGLKKDALLDFVKNEEELVTKILELERQKFEEIFTTHDFEGVNAIEILLTVSKEVARNFILVSPALTIHLKEEFPEIYQDHFQKRLDFIFGKIQINLTKGINQGMYREDLSIELLARLYLSRLIDIHNPQLFPPEKFSFETLFDVMFESFVRSVARPEGIAHFEKMIKKVKFEIGKG
jgi:TetR/AcrR family transcriptional regulator, cholesterol catabolism regulator